MPKRSRATGRVDHLFLSIIGGSPYGYEFRAVRLLEYLRNKLKILVVIAIFYELSQPEFCLVRIVDRIHIYRSNDEPFKIIKPKENVFMSVREITPK